MRFFRAFSPEIRIFLYGILFTVCSGSSDPFYIVSIEKGEVIILRHCWCLTKNNMATKTYGYGSGWMWPGSNLQGNAGSGRQEKPDLTKYRPNGIRCNGWISYRDKSKREGCVFGLRSPRSDFPRKTRISNPVLITINRVDCRILSIAIIM